MREIGVRELREALSEQLRRVEDGEELRVTVRGHAIADIVPVRPTAEDRIAELVASGVLTPATKPKPKTAPPLARGSRPASELIFEERDAER